VTSWAGVKTGRSFRGTALRPAAVRPVLPVGRRDLIVPVEAKGGSRFSQQWCRGLRAAEKLAGLGRRIVVFPEGEPMRTEDGIDVPPFSRFAKIVAEGSLSPRG
jgi:hypothetical protein